MEPEDIRKLKGRIADLATHCATYDFLGQIVKIHTDCSALLELFAAMYGRFSCKDEDSGREPLVFYAILESDVPGYPLVLSGDRVERLFATDLIYSHAYMVILNALLARVSKYYVVHSAVVGKGDDGAMFMGASGYGKSTLVLELVSRGMAFLSDEFAPIHRNTDLVHPFPRAVGVKESGLGLASWLDQKDLVQVKNIGRGYKYLLDVGSVPGLTLGAPVHIRRLYVLEADGKPSNDRDAHLVEVALRSGQASLPSTLEALPGVTLERTFEGGDYPVLRYRVTIEQVDAFSKLCEQGQKEVLYFERVEEHRPDFKGRPVLRDFAKSEAAMLMMRNLRNRRGVIGGSEDFANKAGKTYMRFVRFLSGVSCAKLTMGPLKETADLVERSMEEE